MSSRARGELVAHGGVRARHRSPIDDGVRRAAPREARAADRGVDRERGRRLLASHEEVEPAAPAGFIHVARAPAPFALVPGHAPELRREARERPQLRADGAHAEAHGQERDLVDLRASQGVRRRVGGVVAFK